MPLSKNRKSHSRKAKQRKTDIANNRRRIDKMYKSIYEELRSRPTSVTDMLNKEDEGGGLPADPTQTSIDFMQSKTVVTNAKRDYTVVDTPEFQEPITIASPFNITEDINSEVL